MFVFISVLSSISGVVEEYLIFCQVCQVLELLKIISCLSSMPGPGIVEDYLIFLSSMPGPGIVEDYLVFVKYARSWNC